MLYVRVFSLFTRHTLVLQGIKFVFCPVFWLQISWGQWHRSAWNFSWCYIMCTGCLFPFGGGAPGDLQNRNLSTPVWRVLYFANALVFCFLFLEHFLICFCFDFYRATRMHSTDYAVARCLPVSVSVCHMPVLCLNGYTYSQKKFSTSGSLTIIVFPHQKGWQYSDSAPFP